MKKRSLFRLTLVPVALLLLASAAQDKGPFPDIERYKLKNGLEVIFADYGDLPVTSLTFFVNVGKKSETPGQQGLAGLTANSLLLGNDKFSRTDQDRMLYRLGTGISADANENFTTVSGEFLNTDIGKGFEIVSAVLLHPTFPQQDIDEEKNLDISQNKPSKMDIGDLASMYGNYFCYGIGHPLGRHFYEAQYKKITTAQIRDFYNFNYTPGNTKLVVCGKPDREKVKALIEQYFGGWNATYGEVNGSSYDIPPIKTREFAFVPKDSAKQACLLWMKKGPAAGSKDMTAFIIANAVFSDHLTKEIREKRGYTYGIYSTFSQAQDDGIFRARTQVRNDVMFATMTAFDNVLTEFYAKGPTEAELAKFKTMLKSDILSMEEPGEIASLINPWVYKDYEKRRLVLGELDAMDLATVNKAVKKYFTPDSYKLIIAGDPVALAGQLGKIQGLRKIELSEIERDQ